MTVLLNNQRCTRDERCARVSPGSRLTTSSEAHAFDPALTAFECGGVGSGVFAYRPSNSTSARLMTSFISDLTRLEPEAVAQFAGSHRPGELPSSDDGYFRP